MSAGAAAPAAPAAVAALPYPNALQARQTTDTHRRLAAEAVQGYRDTLVEEQVRLRQDDAVLSEEETVQLQRRAELQKSANASAAQFRQRACDVVAGLRAETADTTTNADDGTIISQTAQQPASEEVDVYHAACDGDVGALTKWIQQQQQRQQTSSAEESTACINAVGQPDPSTYNGVQFQQRWLFRAPPLVFAAAFGREEAVHFLLAHGADPNARSSTGLRAIDYAEKRNYANIVAMLRGNQQ